MPVGAFGGEEKRGGRAGDGRGKGDRRAIGTEQEAGSSTDPALPRLATKHTHTHTHYKHVSDVRNPNSKMKINKTWERTVFTLAAMSAVLQT